MKAIIAKTPCFALCFALLLGVSAPTAALAHGLVNPATAPNENLPKVKLDTTPEGPMGQVGPGDMLTTPKSREELQKEMVDRERDPAAMDKQMDKTESELGLRGKR
ncbi:exported hypothetical protein [uncultured delta proteobacterium]|uniref:Uncharacterized protein n=1 Tax=uncultured delta proteobacterium TaxID=34034 RepID=A0A212JX72_9DELT|nr:exported hypothetical protein [uncultured delta proteobacterium]